jgi:hypothetical protein
MTKPTIKSSSRSLSKVMRPEAEFPIHKKSHPKLYTTSYKSDCSPYLVWTLIRKNAQQNPVVLSLFKNSNKNAPSLGDLGEAASSKLVSVENALNEIEQPSSQVDSFSQALKNFEDASESVTASRNEAVTIDLSDSLEDLDIDELELAIQSLDDDSLEQTISGQESAADNIHITNN